jgi:hypothetical protein
MAFQILMGRPGGLEWSGFYSQPDPAVKPLPQTKHKWQEYRGCQGCHNGSRYYTRSPFLTLLPRHAQSARWILFHLLFFNQLILDIN